MTGASDGSKAAGWAVTDRPARSRFVASDHFPSELWAEIATAAERSAELAAAGRELHFVRHAITGRVVAEVRDLEGTVLRVIAASEALELLSGTELP